MSHEHGGIHLRAIHAGGPASVCQTVRMHPEARKVYILKANNLKRLIGRKAEADSLLPSTTKPRVAIPWFSPEPLF